MSIVCHSFSGLMVGYSIPSGQNKINSFEKCSVLGFVNNSRLVELRVLALVTCNNGNYTESFNTPW